jgi:hypothetical protein
MRHSTRTSPGCLAVVVIIFIIVRIATRASKSGSRTNYRYTNPPPYQPTYRPPPTLVQPPPIAAPPPVVQAEWYFVESGASVGPLTWADFCTNVSSGRVATTTLVFGPGMTEWIEAQRVGGLVFPAAPATWTCGKCGQQVVATVNNCWNCGAAKV